MRERRGVRERSDGFGARGRRTSWNWERFNQRRGIRQEQKHEAEAAHRNRRRNQDIWGYDRRIYNQATVFFFTNFPDEWSYENMWQTFRRFGRVLAIYSPPRRTRRGSRFGFVRFLEVKDEWELEHQLDQIRIGDFKLWVNRPKFTEKESHRDSDHRLCKKEGVRGQRSYADVVKGNSEEESNRVNKPEATRDPSLWQQKRGDRKKSQSQVWLPKDKEQVKHSLEFKVQEEDLSWLEGCYVGVAHSVEIIPNLQEKFFMEGYFSCKVRAMGGKLVLFEGGDKEEIKDLVEQASQWLGQWFSEVNPWNTSMVSRERFVWLRCQGVPAHAWRPDFFAAIGAVWGKFITLDDSTSLKKRLDIGRLLISTSAMEFISKVMNVKVNGEPFIIKVMEEEASNGIFSMKSDHLFNLMSESDNDALESWSVDSDFDNEIMESVQEGGGSKGVRSLLDGKLEEDDVDEDDIETDTESRGELAHIRWKKERQNGKEDQISVVNDVSFNAEGYQEDLAESGEKRDHFQNPGNLDMTPADWVTVPETQPIGQKKQHPRGEDVGPYKHANPIDQDGRGTKIISELAQQELYGPVIRGPNAVEVCHSREDVGANPINSNCADVEASSQKDQEKENSSTGSRPSQRAQKEHSFWEGFMTESGTEKEWMGRNLRRISKFRKKKSRSCGSVYRQGAKRSKEREAEEGRPKFHPGSQNQVAGESVNDSGIGNRNEILKRAQEPCIAERIWEFAKEIGAGHKGNEHEVIRRIKDMEERDKELFRISKVSTDVLGGTEGRKFTWYQPNGTVMSRLDRFLLSEQWGLNWGDVKQWGLKRTIADHSPILLKNQTIDWGPKPFQFFDMWIEIPEFKELVRRTWRSTEITGWHGYRLKEKLKETKNVLKVWSKSIMPEVDSNIQKCKESIAALDLKAETSALSAEEVDLRKNSFLQLWRCQKMKESMWRQKARKSWMKDGDAITKFFHRCVKGRRRRNEIVSIQVGDKVTDQVNEIKEEVANYFEKIFSEDRWQRPHLDGIAFKMISEDENSLLLAPFSEEEVKQAVWNCDCSKAPGPDGFNFRFVREMWEEIKDDMMGYVEDFYKHGKLVKGINSSFIVLIPKVINPQKIEEFRPISLIGVMYKVIAKLLANRLCAVVDKIIGECQMAFVGGRQMADSIVIANEIIDEAKRKKKASFALKVDFEKAYDNVYDTILFGKAEEENIWAAKSIMRTFELVSGLKINFGKSQLMGISVSDEWKTKMAYILKCKLGAFPCKYLGVPIGGNGRNIKVWKPLIETFKRKLCSWKGRFLSLGGRITLLNSVLSNIPVYLMSVHLLPKGVILSLDKIRRNFLWGGEEGKRKTSWVCWDMVCKSKMEGGLGVKELRSFNLALLGKWWSRLASGNNGLFCRIIEGKYGSVDSHWLEWVQENGLKGSSWWRNICKLDHIAQNKRGWLSDGFNLKMGEGNTVRFWKDMWTGNQSLADQFPALFRVSSRKEDRICNMGEWRDGKWEWFVRWRRSLFEWEKNKWSELQALLDISKPVQEQKDKWEWKHDKDGVYTVKTAYRVISSNNGHGKAWIFKRIWSRLVPSKVSAFAWQLIQDRIPTKINLFRRGIITDTNLVLCGLCGESTEDSNHLFIHYRNTCSVWQKCLQWWGISTVMPNTCHESFEQHQSYFKESSVRAGWDVVWLAFTWSIWMARNGKIFKNSVYEDNRIFELVQLRAFNWIKGKANGYSFTMYEWMMEPVLCVKAKRKK
ncbi:hypothetical protein SLEP1_g50328 [Rubroshorea leprosula]|uniref:RRM domain-containing protein n=1 Tax=Rubroshorea leprosula TaxID=152421 RepID=A0AAV5LZM4_9ROSI|nr:hypothetical protein SLEP1_g50328 [Rubroshorea leprosula]